jgi:hypothetical protein
MEQNETKEERIAKLEAYIRDTTSELKKLKGEGSPGGGEGGDDAGHTVEDEATALFEKMSPAEVTELYLTDRPKWQKLMDGVQSAGDRKLEKLTLTNRYGR